MEKEIILDSIVKGQKINQKNIGGCTVAIDQNISFHSAVSIADEITSWVINDFIEYEFYEPLFCHCVLNYMSNIDVSGGETDLDLMYKCASGEIGAFIRELAVKYPSGTIAFIRALVDSRNKVCRIKKNRWISP